MNGSANIDAMAPDYMSLCIAYISLYEATLAPIYLVKAVKWMNIAIEKLWDNDSGGFYFAAEHQDLIARQKDYYDGASPSANSLAYHCLSKLASLTSEIRWAAYAEKLLMSGLAHIQAFPQGHLFMLKSVLENRYKNTHLILAAKEQNEEVQNWIKTLQSITNQTISTVLVTEENRVHFELIAPFVASIPTPKNEQTITAYICQNQECGLPINDLSAVVKLVNS